MFVVNTTHKKIAEQIHKNLIFQTDILTHFPKKLSEILNELIKKIKLYYMHF